MSVGTCLNCRRPNILIGPLHGDKGGPPFCVRCGCDWHAKHSRKRKFGRIVVKAMKAYMKEGGSYADIDKLKFRACGVGFFAPAGEDTIGADCNDISSELLEATIRLTHPDRHPQERQESATHVTRELVALRPFVFPEPNPDPQPEPKESDASIKLRRVRLSDSLQPSYPCGICIDQIPYYYCTTCKVKWEKIQRDKRERRNSKQREWYARRKSIRRWKTPPAICAMCSEQFKGKRKDAKYCSARCRQKAHRAKDVTNKCESRAATLNSRNANSQHAGAT